MERRSRHPKINYWFWTDQTIESGSYRETVKRIAEKTKFNMLTLTDRGCDFWDPTHKRVMAELVEMAHERGIKVVFTPWPKGQQFPHIFVDEENAAAIAIDHETVVT